LAIENLNGFQADSSRMKFIIAKTLNKFLILEKRLKVQFKKGNENEANPNFGKFTPF
jgi:hypothetical protein